MNCRIFTKKIVELKNNLNSLHKFFKELTTINKIEKGHQTLRKDLNKTY